MTVTARRVVLFLIGLFLAVAVIAYGSGSLRLGNRQPEQVAATAPTANQSNPTPSGAQAPDTSPAPASPTATAPSTPQPAAAAIAAPSFDILRVESDGSTVVAGRANAGSSVELVSGSTVLGTANAGPGGDFAIVLDRPLDAGDHSLVLRATAEAGVATSLQTAIVSVPQDDDGQVLAMVEEPGQPSRLITVPEAEAQQQPVAEQTAAPQAPSQPAPAQEPAPGSAALPAAQAPSASADDVAAVPAPAPAEQPAPTANPSGRQEPVPSDPNAPAVEAVEIEGGMIYVAGRAAPGAKLRIYATDLLLGEATATPEGRFLLETSRDLAVGSYTVRVDVLAADGSVIARAAVPFEREPGEAIAAVAPAAGSEPTAPATPATPSAARQPTTVDQAAGMSGAEPAAPTPSTERLTGNTGAAAGSSASPAETAMAPALEPARGAVIIRRGDSLWRISKRAYGQGVRYSTIYLANQDQIQNPNRIWPGQIFRMPESTPEGDKADMNQLGDQATTRN